jgi:hypothetical protein
MDLTRRILVLGCLLASFFAIILAAGESSTMATDDNSTMGDVMTTQESSMTTKNGTDDTSGCATVGTSLALFSLSLIAALY